MTPLPCPPPQPATHVAPCQACGGNHPTTTCPGPRPPKKGLTPEAVRIWFRSQGYALCYDRSVNLYAEVNGRRYRAVVSRVACRLEAEVKHVTGKSWVRLRSGYLRNLWIADGQLHGLSQKGCQ